jgi:aryl-alcohol dehydrogenase-like predicted oxidoreductase
MKSRTSRFEEAILLTSTLCANKTTLPRSGIEISRIGLGLAHTHLLSVADRQRLLQRALELGITHFDTARLYADGMSEVWLGEFVRGNRDKISITTKFGLLPTPFIGSMGVAAQPLRKARAVLNKLGVRRYPQRSYTRETLRKSLHASLRALKTGYIDVYCLHEPEPDSSVSGDLFEELERTKMQGDIRWIGVSGAHIDNIVANFGASIDVIQSAEASWAESRFVPDITHSLFSAFISPGRDSSQKRSVEQLLQQALSRRPEGAVIVQTRSVAHLEQIVTWAAGR